MRLEERDMGVAELSASSGLPTEVLELLLNKETSVTPEIAAGLALALDTSESYWRNLQTIYDEDVAINEARAEA